MDAVDTIEQDGCKAALYMDEDASNPRKMGDELGTMVCWHPDYYLGDYQVTDQDRRGAVEDRFERDDFKSLEQLRRWLGLAKQATVILPLYLYDHSGITMSVGHAGDNPFDSAGWDSTNVGFIFTTPARVAELCGSETYTPADYEGTHEEWIAEQLRAEVNTYDDYLTGSVYGYVVKDENGVELDSCWNFCGYDYAMSEMKEALADAATDRKAARALEQAEESGVHLDPVPA